MRNPSVDGPDRRVDDPDTDTAIGRKIGVPVWVIGLLKYFSVIVATCAIGYARISIDERDIIDLKAIAKAHDAKFDVRGEAISTLERRLGILETSQTINQQNITSSLMRLEAAVHEIQIEIRKPKDSKL